MGWLRTFHPGLMKFSSFILRLVALLVRIGFSGERPFFSDQQTLEHLYLTLAD